MLAPALHRFSVQDYHLMAETGVLRPDARVELVNGRIIDMSPIGPYHGGVTNQLLQIFTAAAQGRWVTTVQNPLSLDAHSEPQPDLMLLKPVKDYYRRRHPGPEDVLLLIEVSDSTLATNLEEKLPAYGRAGVGEVWIVNLCDETIEIHLEPHFNGYGRRAVLRAGDVANPQSFPDVAVDVAELLQL
jgi:Uma2 family endonuclease